MKKFLLPSLGLLALSLASCDDNKNGWDTNTMNVQVQSLALLIPTSADQEPVFVQDYKLRFAQSLEDGKMGVKSMSPITLPNGKTFSFETPYTNISGNNLTYIIDPLPYTTEDGTTVRLRSRLTQQYYAYSTGVNAVIDVNQPPVNLTVINIGTDYILKTLQPTMTFCGKTTALVGGQNPYTNEGTSYQVTLDVVNRKAEVIIYDAHFAEAMPLIRVMRLRDVPLTVDRSTGYQINGENIIPEVLEGETWVPNEKFVFNKFSLVPTAENLSTASINFTVATVFSGTCQGSYIVQ